MSDRDFVNRLSSRRPGLEQLEPGWRLVDDVLAGKIKRRCSDGWNSPYFPKGRLEGESEYSLRVELTPFFPQTPQLLASRLGALFKQRIQIETNSTPHPAFAETDRLTSALSLKGRRERHARFERFLKEAGRRHVSFEDLAVQASCLAQTHGFCAALLDRDPLPEDVKGASANGTPHPGLAGGAGAGQLARPSPSRGEGVGARVTNNARRATLNVSQAEANARDLGRPYLALYAAPEILDWDFGSDGRLAWVKFGEEELWRPRWDAEPEVVRVYRIVDREFIHVYRVRTNGNGTPHPAFADMASSRRPSPSGGEGNGPATVAETPVAHGFGEVPVVFLHPFPAQDGIGRSLLLRSAEADIAATRVLSDLVWDLFLLGNPILTFKTTRSEEEQKQLCLGASRYIPLRNSRPGEEDAEELKFVQLDSTGIELLFKAHGLFAAQARQAGSSGDEASAMPVQQTGIAQAWRFKTGEERVLFMLARALEPFLSQCLSLAVRALETSPPGPLSASQRGGEDMSVTVRLPDSFDVAPANEALDGAEKLLELAEKFGQTELARAALSRIEASLGVLPAATREALRAERERLNLASGQRQGR